MKGKISRISIVSEITSELQKQVDILTMTDEELYTAIAQAVDNQKKWAKNSNQQLWQFYLRMTYKDRASLETDAFNSIRGLSIIDKIIADKTITEVMINGYDAIFIEKRGRLTKIPEQFESPEKLLNVITKLVSDADRTVNMSNPIVDTRLADGSRVNVVLPPVAINGPIVTIRRFPDNEMTMEQLITFGSLTKEAADFLQSLVAAKYNIFICGGTGSGKTTFLNALANSITEDERLITIEDSAELQIRNTENIVRLEARNSYNSESKPITIRDLIKTSLRMRPERIIVGEVRGAEALDMLQAMNTGHDGSLSTGHANSTYDMFSRLETMVLSGAEKLPLSAIQKQVASAIDIIVFLSRLRDHSRKTMEISEVGNYSNGSIELNQLFVFQEDVAKSTSNLIVGRLHRTPNKMHRTHKLHNSGLYREL